MIADTGRVGKRECASLVCISFLISGLFALNTERTYASGNSAYVSTPLAGLIALLIFLLALAAMKKSGALDLYALFSHAFGRAAAAVLSVVCALALLVAAALPLIRILIILSRYIYPEAAVSEVAVFFAPCLIVPLLLGFETIARTGKLFFVLTVLSFAIAFLVAAPSFDPSHLYPLLGDGLPALLQNTLFGTERFLPALTALLILAKSAQGLKSAASSARIGALAGALLCGVALLLLGLIYPYAELSKMHAPMYRITMAVRMGSAYLRTDKVLLFFWTVAGFLTALFYTFAAAEVFCRAFNAGDVRPAGAAFGMCVSAFILIGHENFPWLEAAAAFLSEWLWAFFALPILLSAAVAALRKQGRAAYA